MNLDLPLADRELSDRARAFTEEHLIPCELECEMNNGLSQESLRAIRTATIEWEFNAINHSVEDGGQGLDLFQQVLVQEQMGKATGALWDVVWRPAIPLRFGTEEQKETYLRPACRGDRRDAYAITEAEAGSDPNEINTSARRSGDGFVINGAKWFVTVGDVADFLLVHALVDGDRTKPTVFFVDKDREGVSIVRSPRYMHTFVFEHPEFSFTDVHVPAGAVLGEIGSGYELTKDWFVEERLMIGARTVGAATRALELATEFASGRVQFGRAIVENQGIEFMLADMAAEIMAAKSLLYRVAWEAGRTEMDRKRLHVSAAAVKLVCSETAWRVADRAVQIFGGRGYMREQPVERLYRDLRVDRIWEGTSEIQRLILGGELRKRGPDAFTTWP
jgi:alkylation response protein AidB-like acyl-CoA dehydrogenase